MNVQYGCGKCAPQNWVNFDVSPTLLLEKLPLLGALFVRSEWGAFPKNVKFGNIVKGLPNIQNESCNAVYCSHVLEHIPYYDLNIALTNTYNILNKRGVFRLVIPDMEFYINNYLNAKKSNDPMACHTLIYSTIMRPDSKPKGLKNKLITFLGHSQHHWNYDYLSMKVELEKVGFKNIRRAYFNDSQNQDFLTVEDQGGDFAETDHPISV